MGIRLAVLFAEGHRAESQRRHPQIALAQSSEFHIHPRLDFRSNFSSNRRVGSACVVGALAPYNHGVPLAGDAHHVGPLRQAQDRRSPTYIWSQLIRLSSMAIS